MKKALSLLLAGSMVFSLAACGGSKDNAEHNHRQYSRFF